jgi:hypothetical protein
MDTETKPAPAVDKLAEALAAAQGTFTNPKKTKTANAGKYSYSFADLADVLDAIRQPMASAGLSVVQTIETGPLHLATTLMHTSGQSITSRYPLVAMTSQQDMGSQLTYARRYSLCAILGVAAEEDRDGAVQGERAPASQVAPLEDLYGRMGEAGIGNAKVLAYLKAAGIHDAGAAKGVDTLPAEVVKRLVADWDKALPEIRAAAGKKHANATPATPAAPAATEAPAAHATAAPATATAAAHSAPAAAETAHAALDPYAGIDEALAGMMRAAKITPEQLKAYYVGKGHLPKTVEPCALKADYIRALTQPAWHRNRRRGTDGRTRFHRMRAALPSCRTARPRSRF